MPFYIKVAFKNIFRDKRRSFTLGINYLFVTVLLFILFAVTQGVRKNITENIISSTAGHITISGEYIVKGRTYQGIKNFQKIDSIIKVSFPNSRILTRYNLNSQVYYKGLSKRLSFVGLQNNDQTFKDQIKLENGDWESFQKDINSVIISKITTNYFGIQQFDDLLVSTRSRFGAFNTGTLNIKGIYSTGNYFLRDYAICHFEFLRSLDLADSTTASKMYIFFENLQELDAKRDILIRNLEKAGFIPTKPANNNEALNAVSAASPRYKVQDESVNQNRLTLATVDEVTGIVSQIIAAVNGIGIFIAAIMVFIIAVSILINMRMTVYERMREIGTLRALGAEQSDVINLFIFENILLNLLFTSIGIVIGFLLTITFSHFVTFPSEGTVGLFLNQGHFVLEPTIGSIVFIYVCLTSLTALFSYFPARHGGRIPPVDALNKTGEV